MTTDQTARIAEDIVQAVAELPDRTSPDDWPDAMLVTADELRAIVTPILTTLQAALEGWQHELAEAIYEDDECMACGALRSLNRHGPVCRFTPLLTGLTPSAQVETLRRERDEAIVQRDKWLNAFNRSEQFQNGPTKRAEAAEARCAELASERDQ